MRGYPFYSCLTSPGMQPEFYCDRVHRETNPERDAEELPRFQMCPRAGSEEYTHHRPGGSNAEQYSDRARHPPPLQQMLACAHVLVSTRKRQHEQAVEEKYCRSLHPP